MYFTYEQPEFDRTDPKEIRRVIAVFPWYLTRLKK